MIKDNIFIGIVNHEHQIYLRDKILSDIQNDNFPAIVVDYSGELTQKYYNKKRGDIIFSPSNEMCGNWNFLKDCSNDNELGEFFDALIQYNARDNRLEISLRDIHHMKIIFIDFVNFLKKTNSFSFQNLKKIISSTDIDEISKKLKGTQSIEVLNKTNNHLVPALLRLFSCVDHLHAFDSRKDNCLFSIKDYLNSLKKGSNACLFLGSDLNQTDHALTNLKIMIDLCVNDLVVNSEELTKEVYFIFDKMHVLSKMPPIINALGANKINFVMPFLSIPELTQSYGEIEGNFMFTKFDKYFFSEANDPISTNILKNNFNDINPIPHTFLEEEYLYMEKNSLPFIQKLNLKDLPK